LKKKKTLLWKSVNYLWPLFSGFGLTRVSKERHQIQHCSTHGTYLLLSDDAGYHFLLLHPQEEVEGRG
jgi:hypothetical protein